MKIPFLIRKFQCPYCDMNGHYDNSLLKCFAKGGMYPCLWIKVKFLPIEICCSQDKKVEEEK